MMALDFGFKDVALCSSVEKGDARPNSVTVVEGLVCGGNKRPTASGVRPAANGVRPTASGVRQAVNGIKQTASLIKQIASCVKQAVSVAKQNVSVAKQTASVVKQIARLAKQTASIVKQTVNTVKQTASVAKQAANCVKHAACFIKHAENSTKKIVQLNKTGYKGISYGVPNGTQNSEVRTSFYQYTVPDGTMSIVDVNTLPVVEDPGSGGNHVHSKSTELPIAVQVEALFFIH